MQLADLEVMLNLTRPSASDLHKLIVTMELTENCAELMGAESTGFRTNTKKKCMIVGQVCAKLKQSRHQRII
jgi:hypothetical protein